jgi:hypothetical protein
MQYRPPETNLHPWTNMCRIVENYSICTIQGKLE